jgi:thiosulfate/3-mercaptopyruvate sulfurtransferase
MTDDPVVSTAWLADHLDDPAVRILDCRYYFDDLARGHRAYLEAHIPGAQHLDWTTAISEPRGGLKTMVPSADFLRQSMERLGIGDDTLIVGYDDEGGHFVSRLWLILRRFGNNNVRLVEGGWTKWLAEGRGVRSGPEPAPKAASFTIGSERPELIASVDDVLRLRDVPDSVLVDVRRLTEFTGEEVRAKHGGHIPWARWLFWQDNLNWSANRDFRAQDEIRRRFESAEVTPDKDVVVYCQGGVRAAHTALALTRLGYPRVRVYDGSWEEWGGRDDLPIAQGEP